MENPFTYTPSDSELEALVKLTNHPGWPVFLAVMNQAHSDVAVRGIKDMSGKLPQGFYAGYLESLEQTIGRVELLTQQYIDQVSAAQQERLASMPDRSSASGGDTAS